VLTDVRSNGRRQTEEAASERSPAKPHLWCVRAAREQSPASRVLVIGALGLAFVGHIPNCKAQSDKSEAYMTLPGHVRKISADTQHLPRNAEADQGLLTLTVVLNMPPSAEFEALKTAFRNPASANFRKPIPADELRDRFGPTQEMYNSIRTFLEAQGFQLIETTRNRRTITVRGSRALTEQVFSLRIGDFQRGTYRFYATLNNPSVPSRLAPLIEVIDGLSSTPTVHPANVGPPTPPQPTSIAQAYNLIGGFPGNNNPPFLNPLNGRGQTIGIFEYSQPEQPLANGSFNSQDIANWLSFANLPAGLINQLSAVVIPTSETLADIPVNPATNDSVEFVGDVDTALGMAPGAKIIVMMVDQGPLGGYTVAGYSEEYNDAINLVQAAAGGVGGIISQTYTGCEGTDAVDVQIQQAVESIIETAALSGLSVFAAAGDNGNQGDSGCIGSITNVEFPADLASVVGVGGTTLTANVQGTANTYDSETWLNTAFGAGGYGTSQTVSKPAWQFYNSTSMRMVPDVAADADPNTGIVVCLGTTSGSSTPNCTITFGGTSLATPIWAGTWAIVSEAGGAIPAGLGALYDIAQTQLLLAPTPSTPPNPLTNCSYVFNSPMCMQGPNNDFTHLGLGSPNISNLISYLSNAPYITSITPNSVPTCCQTTVAATGFFPDATGTVFWINLSAGWVKLPPTESCANVQSCVFTTPATASGTKGPFPVAAAYPYSNATNPFSGAASYASSEGALKYGGGLVAFGTFALLIAAWGTTVAWRSRHARSG
jgi:kumamolisin